MSYSEDEYVTLSGIQHFAFCRRQWALIYLENQWADNYRTADGAAMHEAAHDPSYRESRGDRLVVRAVKVHSPTLGVSGECDVVEFFRVKSGEEGIPLRGREGVWQPFPVEYKRGRPGDFTEMDALQVCGQALCLEEMLCCAVPRGALYYGETRHRYPVEFTPELRDTVKQMISEMQDLRSRGHTPTVKPSKSCNACSLKDLCLPKLMRVGSASQYIRKHWEEPV